MLDILTFIKEYSYIGIFFIVCLESGIFFPLPGDSLLFTVGLLATRGYLDINIALIVIVCGAISGGGIGYVAGKYLEILTEHKFLKKLFHKGHIEKTRIFFQKHGQATLVIGRFIPVVRTFAPILAGFSEMKRSLFWKYNVIGGLIWGVSITMLGYVFGNTFPMLEKHITLISILIVIISVLPIVYKFVIKKTSK